MSENSDNIPGMPGIGRGILAGCVTCIISFAGTIGLFFYHVFTTGGVTEYSPENKEKFRVYIDILENSEFNAILGTEPLLETISWQFLSTHGVKIQIESSSESFSLNLLAAIRQTPEINVWVYLALPVVILVIAGFVLAYRTGVETPVNGAVAGLYIVLGYAPLIVVLAFLTSTETVGSNVQVGPDLIEATIRAGVVYPSLAGGVGGTVAGIIKS